jgi:hypothetical protein
MNATTAFLCIITFSLASSTIPTQLNLTVASGSDAGSTPSGSQKIGKPATPGKADANVTPGTPSAGKPKQIPVPPDRTRAVEERLRSGQMDKPIAQGEISERLNQLYSGSNSFTAERGAEHSRR